MIFPQTEDWDCLVVHGACFEWLPQIAPGTVSLTVTDPPYESLERHRTVGTTTRLKQSKASSNPWFNCLPNVVYWPLLRMLYEAHALNTHCYVFCDSETEHVILSGRNPYYKPLDEELLAAGMAEPPRGDWTAWPTLSWVKTKRDAQSVNGDELEYDMAAPGMGYHWRRTGERILFLEKGKRKLNELGWPDVLLGPKAGRDDFPTQKPAGVLRRLILNSSNPGDVILDPFAGSGVVAEEACAVGRRAILIEKYPSEWLNKTVEGIHRRGSRVKCLELTEVKPCV